MRRHRTDKNQKLIVEALESCGAFVVNLSQVGDGVPDLLVYLNGWHLIEVKTDEGKWKYKPAQEKFMQRCPVAIPVITTIHEAARWAVKHRARPNHKEAVEQLKAEVAETEAMLKRVGPWSPDK